jgi:hypothetical protein
MRRYIVKGLALGLLTLAVLLTVTYGYWLRALGRSLVYQGTTQVSEAIVIENFDPDYLLFERSTQLLREGQAKRVFVPVEADQSGEKPGAVEDGVVQVMARVAWLPQYEIIPIKEIEPISLNAALQVRDYLKKKNIGSIIVVASGFRSRRSFLLWNAVMHPAGITVSICPVFGLKTPENWYTTWHGRQEVILETVKLLYYRLRVLLQFERQPGLRISETSRSLGQVVAVQI